MVCWALTKYHVQPLLFEHLKRVSSPRQWIAGPRRALRTPFSAFLLTSGPISRRSAVKHPKTTHRFGDPIRTDLCSLPLYRSRRHRGARFPVPSSPLSSVQTPSVCLSAALFHHFPIARHGWWTAHFRLVNKKPINGVRSAAEGRRTAKPFLVPGTLAQGTAWRLG